jgi:HEAT repeat protein/DNA-binding NarL/FixJ family response regulator
MEDKRTMSDQIQVCLVDDDPGNREMLSDVLLDEGYRLTEAYNGRHALDVITQEPPDVVLVDIQMPLMDGYDLIEHLRSDPGTHSLVLIILSASIIRAADFKDVDGYLGKPYDLDDLLGLIQSCVRQRWPTPEDLSLSHAWRAAPTGEQYERLLAELYDPATPAERVAALLTLFTKDLSEADHLDFFLAQWGAALPEPLRVRLVHLLATTKHPLTTTVLAQALSDPAVEVRREAARSYGRRQMTASTDVLLQRLDDVALEVRLAAIAALGQTPSPNALGPLNARLQSGSLQEQSAAIEALRHNRTQRCVQLLLSVAGDVAQDTRIRSQAIQAVGQLGYHGGVTPLLKILEREQALGNRLILQGLIEALGHLSDPQAAPMLAQALTRWTDQSSLLIQACDTLVRLGNPQAIPALEPLLKHADPGVIEKTIEALVQLRDRRSPAARDLKPLILETLRGEHHYHGALIVALAKSGEAGEFVEEWGPQLLAQSRTQQGQAVVYLAQYFKHVPATELTPAQITFCENVRHSLTSFRQPIEAYQRWASSARVMHALIQSAPSQNESLATLIRTDPDRMVRVTALAALSRNRPATAYAVICSQLDHPHHAVRCAAVEALGQLLDLRAIPALAKALTDPARNVTLSAAMALAAFPVPEAAEALWLAMSQAPEERRIDLALALSKSRTRLAADRVRAALHVEDKPRVLIPLIECALKTNDPGMRSVLKPLQKHSNRTVRQCATQAIQRLSGREA